MESAWSRGHPRPRDIPAFNRRQLAGWAIFGVAYRSVVRARLAATAADDVAGEARSGQGQHGVGGRLGDNRGDLDRID